MKKYRNLVLISFILSGMVSSSFSCSEENVQPVPVILLKTNLAKGDTITLRVGLNNDISDSLAIDFGSGALITFRPSNKVFGRSGKTGKIVTNIEAYQTIKQPVEDSIIKIYSPKNAIFLLKCSQNKISNIDLSNCLGIEELDISNNVFDELDLTKANGLKHIQCQNNSIAKIHIPELNSIRSLDCSNNNLITLNTQKCKWLEKLNCSNNYLTKLQFANINKINDLKCNNNSIAPDSIPYFYNISNYYLPQNCDVSGYVEIQAKRWNKTPEMYVVDQSLFIPSVVTDSRYNQETDVLTIDFRCFDSIQIYLNGRNPNEYMKDNIKIKDIWYYLAQDGRVQIRSSYFNDIHYIANANLK